MKVRYFESYKLDCPVLVRLWFKKRYYIHNFFDLANEIDGFIEALTSLDDVDIVTQNRLQRLKAYVQRTRPKIVKIEVVLSSQKGEALLTKERSLLNDDNSLSLNQNTEPLCPDWCRKILSPTPRLRGFFKTKGRHRRAAAVLKLKAGKKFFIWKCKDVKEFESKFNASFQLKLTKGFKPDDIFAALVSHVVENKIQAGTIEVYEKFETSRAGTKMLMKLERYLLYEYVGKSNCLNSTRKQNKPQWVVEILSKKRKVAKSQKLTKTQSA